MASIENKSRTQVSVKKRDDLTKFFPHHKAGAAAAAAYMAELEAEGLKPSATVLDEAYLVRFSTDEGRKSHTARSAAEAEAIKKKVEADQYHGLYVDFTKAHKIKLSDLLIRYLWEEAPRLKGFLITAYQINSWLVDAGLPRQDIAAVHAAHPNPQDPDLHIPTPNGQRMSEPNHAARFILKPFSKLEPSDFTRYVDERVEDVDTAAMPPPKHEDLGHTSSALLEGRARSAATAGAPPASPTTSRRWLRSAASSRASAPGYAWHRRQSVQPRRG